MTLKDRYPEMESDGDDRALEHLVSDLDRMGTASRSGALPVQHEMRIARALQHPATGPRRHSHPLLRRNRPVAVAAAIVCILLLAGATYSAITVLDQAFTMNP